MFEPHYRAYQVLKSHAIELDLEKYQDIYEISRTDMEDAELIASADLAELESADTLHDLKLGIQKIYLLRKLVLCTLMALDADGGQRDFDRWAVAVGAISDLTKLTARAVAHIDEVLREEQGRQCCENWVHFR